METTIDLITIYNNFKKPSKMLGGFFCIDIPKKLLFL